MSNPREFSIQLESDDEVRALIIDPKSTSSCERLKAGSTPADGGFMGGACTATSC
uniref:Uncharacterized protein n=1 Tax=Anguilla anguilla TaxID=7936 RepID=A0A0E9V0I1_ANGAN